MFFLNPTYLWALFGLTIPIAIHLWSKKEGKTIKIGSIKLLSEADSRQSSSIKLNELWLLCIRMLIISFLVLILAEPQIKKQIPNGAITYLIEPSLINNDHILKLIDSLESENSLRLLQKGFPLLSTDFNENTEHRTPNYWQLAKDMETLASDSIIVITNAFSSGLKGKRPQVNTAIEWLIFDGEAPAKQFIEAFEKNDSIELRSLLSNSQGITFRRDRISLNSSKLIFNASKDSLKIEGNDHQNWTALQKRQPIDILLFYEDKFTKEAIYIEAAFNAISKHVSLPFAVKKTKDSTHVNSNSFDCIVWLSDKPNLKNSAKTLLYKIDHLASSMITKGSSKGVFYLTTALNTENIIGEHLPEQLLKLLELHPELDKTIKKYDQSIVSKQELNPIIKNDKTDKAYTSIYNISPWLWLFLALLLILERVIAFIRKQ